ncbi:MAG TPA: endonuclease/exonuclease/phosphatase family protein [Solirubrobacterales bacterium]|nr:endonuclease/exonuclease/phosphatase family protein [Solirubrobacterales bacterium]
MPTVRVCSINGEWMNRWFTRDAEATAQFLPSFSAEDAAPARLAATIEAIGAEIVAIQEAPSREAEMQLFVGQYLGDYEFFLSDAGGQQKLALLYKPDAVDSAALARHEDIAGLIDEWEADVDGDAVLDGYGFTRTPLVVDLVVGGHPLQVVVAHMKSNFINQGKELWESPANRQAYITSALKNRRRISTEGKRTRSYLDARASADPGAAIIVLGDLNDGPGLDYFEDLYLTHNVTDIIAGSVFAPELAFAHAQHDVPADKRFTAEFEDFVPEPAMKRLLLDHVMVSPGLLGANGLRKVDGSGAVYHAEYDAHVSGNGDDRNDRPTDHRPVGVDLAY